MKQHAMDRHVPVLGHIIPIISKLVVCLTQKVNGIVDGIDFTEELSRKIIIIIMFWVGKRIIVRIKSEMYVFTH
jgi:hypothetical protein